jgi:hypothetical protein
MVRASLILHPRTALFLLTTTALVGFAACGEEEKDDPGALGGTCDPTAACDAGLECNPRAAGGSVCTYPAGAACSPDEEDIENGGCAETAECTIHQGESSSTCRILESADCDPAHDFCTNGLVCAEVASGGNRCFGEIVLRGQVADASDRAAIEDAHVMAVDEEGVAVTDVSRTDAAGNYALAVPAARNDDGTPVGKQFTLRAAAQEYQSFPSGVRVALPIDVGAFVREEKAYVVENALTDVDLLPLPAGERSKISGSIVAIEGAAESAISGVLVVAKGAGEAFSGISDKGGHFTIFNVPAGGYELKGYAADVQIETESVSVPAEPLEGVELSQLGDGTQDVSGNVQIVNAPGGAVTSVILVVEDTFDADAARGEVPRGLRAPRTGVPNVAGDFTIRGVPAGRYVVLAAYENDALVRDPDTNIAGTDFVTLEVPAGAGALSIPESFKVTEALATVSPGANDPEAVTAKPQLVWADDSSEDWYDVRVFDAFGNEVWTALALPAVTGSANASVQYDGPLDPGMYYQFRVTSWRQPGGGDAAPISATEDLRGVFFTRAE